MTHKGYKFSKEHKEKLSNSWDYDKHFTDKCRKNISLSNTGKTKSEEAKKNMKGYSGVYIRTKPIWNKKLTKETDERVKRISEKANKTKNSEEWKDDIGKKAADKISKTRLKLFKEDKIKIWNKNLTKETNDILRKAGEKISISNKGRILSEESKKNIGLGLKGKKISEEAKQKRKENPNAGMRNKFHSEKTKKKISKNKKGQKLSEITKQKMRNNWQNKEFKEKMIKNTLKAMLKRPTSFEQKIILLCSKYKLPFIYTGDGRVLINFKNPDFVNEKDKIAIEVFLDYFKIRDYGSVENYMKIRSENFAKAGYKVIFINKKEIMSKNWEEICLNKINTIINGGIKNG